MSSSLVLSRNGAYVALYLANQALAVATTLALVRYGQGAFSLSWCLGVLIAMGWGTTGYGLFDPSLAARAWTLPSREGLFSSLRLAGLSAVALAVVCTIPWSAATVSGLAGLSIEWVAAFVSVGIFRAFAQLLSTYSLRLGRHPFVAALQIAARLMEVGLVVAGCLLTQTNLLILGLLVYPAAQLVVFAVEAEDYKKLPISATQESNTRGWIISLVGRMLEMILPTIWLRVAGDTVFVAYKAVTSALGFSILLPRYWFVVVPPRHDLPVNGVAISALVLAASITTAGAFQLLTAAVPTVIFAWSLIPVVFNSLVMPAFSRWRQQMLRDGEIIPPAVVGIFACLVEAGMLAAIACAPFFSEGRFLVANLGFCMSFLSWRVLFHNAKKSS